MQDTIFIKVLEYGEAVGLSGTTFQSLKNYIQNELAVDFNHSAHRHTASALKSLYHECFNLFDDGQEDRRAILKTEYYFRLIEYRELRETRGAAKSANKNAFMAIGISVCVMVACVVLSFTQLSIPASINKEDLQILIDTSSGRREVKIDNLQMVQILSAIESKRSNVKNQKPKAILQSNEVQHHELINKYFEDQ